MSKCPFHQSNSSRRGNDESSQSLLSEDDLECPVCLRLLYLPMTLSCGHTFCGSCLVNISTRTQPREGNPSKISFCCPICRDKSELDELPRPNVLLSALITKYLPDATARREIEAERDEAEERERFSLTKKFRVVIQPYYEQRAIVITTEGQSRCPMSRGGFIPLAFYVARVDIRLPLGSVPQNINYVPTNNNGYGCSFTFQHRAVSEGYTCTPEEASSNVARVFFHFQPRFQISPRELKISMTDEFALLEVDFDGRLVHR